MKPKRICHIFNEINFSGAEVMYAQAGPIFKDQNLELIAISTGPNFGNYTEEMKKAGYVLYHKPYKTGLKHTFRFMSYLITFYRFLKDEKIETLHIHRSTQYWFFALIAKIAGIKSIRTVHNVFKNRWFTRPKAIIERWSARKILGLTFHSIGKSVEENELCYYKNPTVRINNWFDSSRFFPSVNSNEHQEIRKELNIPENSFVIISIGRCTEVKNHKAIILAINESSIKGKIFYLHLGCGETEKAEKELVQSLNLQNQVRFVGVTNEVRKYLIASDVHIMPSRFEGLSITSLEAMACGVPSILYNSPGLRDLIDNDDCGFLVEPFYKNITTAINTLYENKSLYDKMQQKAITNVNSEYSIDISTKKIIDLYRVKNIL